MVRNEQLEPASEAAKAIARFIKEKITQKGYTVEEVAKKLGRAKSYASIRLSGLKTFSIDDLDKIAKMLGYASTFTLIAEAHEYSLGTPTAIPEEWNLAASEDANKQAEREYDDFGA